MKHTNGYTNHTVSGRSHHPAYPNAADTNYFTRKASEILTAIVSGMGIITVMTLFLVIA